VNKEQSLWFVY